MNAFLLPVGLRMIASHADRRDGLHEMEGYTVKTEKLPRRPVRLASGRSASSAKTRVCCHESKDQ